MWLAVIVLIIAVAAIILGTAKLVATRAQKKPSPREIALAQALRQVRDRANQFRETDTGLSIEISDIISGLEGRELL